MKLSVRQLRHLIREELDLGDIEFSPERTDGADTSEDNTSYEDYLFKALDNWFTGNRIPPDLEYDLRSLMSDYPKFFHEPRVDEVYRGLAVAATDVARWTKLPPETFIRAGDAMVDFTAYPRRNSMGGTLVSWTTEYDSAEGFSKGTNIDAPSRPTRLKPVMLIMHAKVSDNPNTFLDLADIAGRVHAFKSWSYEEEALALGPVKVYKIEWTVKDFDEPEEDY